MRWGWIVAEYVSESIRAAMQDLAQRAEAAESEMRELRAQNARYAQRIAKQSTSMQELFDVALVDVKANIDGLLGRLLALVSDWQANGNSRELADPTADVWQACARQLLDALNPEGVDRG